MPKFLDEFPGPSPKPNLRIAQVRILRALVEHSGWVDRNEVAKLSVTDPGWVGDALGRVDPQTRREREATIGYPSLLTLGYVTERCLEVEEGVTERSYRITPAGVRALGSIPS